MKALWASLVLVAVAACSGGSAKSADPTTTSSVATTTTTESTTTTGLSVSQVASVVAGAQDQLIDVATDVQIGCVAICDAVASIKVRSLGVLADTLDVNLEALKIRTPTIPSEIAALYDETLAALRAVSAASTAYTTACATSCLGTSSGKLTAELYNTAMVLKSRLAAWGPYL